MYQGGTTRGYGQRYDPDQKRMILLHRWVVAQIHGWEAIEGKVVMHLCDNPGCFRYDHLRIGTQAENCADRDQKGRNGHRNKTHCPHGHAYDEENTRIDVLGKRCCRACDRIAARRRYARTLLGAPR
jgi:hypothetical protein